MTKLDRLKREARESATFRGHKLGTWYHYGPYFWRPPPEGRTKKILHAFAYCQVDGCRAQVTVTNIAQPNECKIMGDAVDLACPVRSESNA